MPHHPPASPASPASPAYKTYGGTTGVPLADVPNRITGHENGVGAGKTLTAQPGQWRGATPITLTYQWTRDGVNIAGATTISYTTVAGDVGHMLNCNEIATSSAGSTTTGSSNPVPA